jgi:hypothetical protein
MRRLLLPIALAYTRRIYRRLARQVAAQVEDYVSSGYSVVAMVAVDASPSCGLCKTLDPRRSLESVGRLPETAGSTEINAALLAALIEGKGMFTDALQRQLARRNLQVPFLAHDLIAELHGEACLLRP